MHPVHQRLWPIGAKASVDFTCCLPNEAGQNGQEGFQRSIPEIDVVGTLSSTAGNRIAYGHERADSDDTDGPTQKAGGHTRLHSNDYTRNRRDGRQREPNPKAAFAYFGRLVDTADLIFLSATARARIIPSNRLFGHSLPSFNERFL
tara:strand:- start:52 stop:492 length:441 start_codon:yes stop_codon:yes gene_type:complete